MRVGDILEWLAAAALIAAGYLYAGLPMGLVGFAMAMAYFAQLYDLPLPHRKPRRDLRRTGSSPAKGDPTPMFHCDVCGGISPFDKPHFCDRS